MTIIRLGTFLSSGVAAASRSAPPSARRGCWSGRGGVTIMEGLAALAVTTITLSTMTVFLSSAAATRHEQQFRQMAQFAASSELERLLATPYDDLMDRDAGEESEPATLPDLPGGRVEVRIDPVSEPAGKRISVTVLWTQRDGGPSRPVRLVSYRYRAAEESP